MAFVWAKEGWGPSAGLRPPWCSFKVLLHREIPGQGFGLMFPNTKSRSICIALLSPFLVGKVPLLKLDRKKLVPCSNRSTGGPCRSLAESFSELRSAGCRRSARGLQRPQGAGGAAALPRLPGPRRGSGETRGWSRVGRGGKHEAV